MKKLLFINCIMREDSRTKLLSDYALSKLEGKYEISEINLANADIKPLNPTTLTERVNNGEKDENILALAKKFQEADKIILAAPFWDMSFPSILRVFFERISLNDITFITDENGDTKGNCNADKLLYLTTRGLNIADRSANDIAYAYLKAITTFFGIKMVKEVSMNKLDLVGTDFDKEFNDAKFKLDIILKTF